MPATPTQLARDIFIEWQIDEVTGREEATYYGPGQYATTHAGLTELAMQPHRRLNAG